MNNGHLSSVCEAVYSAFARSEFLSPDPLELVVRYEDLRDREIAGFIASSLAVGRAGAIVAVAGRVISRLGAPYEGLLLSSDANLRSICSGFSYRFFGENHLYGLLLGLRQVVNEHGSIENCLSLGSSDQVLPGLSFLVDQLYARSGTRLDDSILVAHPSRGSACKRLLLFLRWMVRKDQVDPGGWTLIRPAQLLVPIDTHMLSVSRQLGLTKRKQATLSVSKEVTARFAAICPDDPVRYDFALTRLGIHPSLQRESLERLIEQTRK